MPTLTCKFSPTFNRSRRILDSFCMYSSSDFDNMPKEVAKVNKSGNCIVKVLGNNLPRLADWSIRFTGDWKYNAKYGWSFIVEHYELLKPSTLKGLVRYLSSNIFKGVGVTTANAVVKQFKEETLDVIENTPELLLRVPGVNIEKLDTIKECYNKNVAYSKLCSYLSVYSISPNVSSKVYDRFKKDALEMIQANPYILMDIEGIGFVTCEKIARNEGVALDSEIRIKSAIRQTLIDEGIESGHMFMDYSDFEKKCLKTLNEAIVPEPVNTDRFRDIIKKIKDTDVAFRSKLILLKEYDEMEQIISEKVCRMLSPEFKLSVPNETIVQKLEDYCRTCTIQPSEGQKEAIVRSLSNRVSVITGGAGTGKTTILNGIIAVYKSLYPDKEITLLSPTGKAARRITEATNYPAQTIHSKIQIFKEQLEYASEIDPGLVVVDESSMIDANVMAKLSRSIGHKDHQLVLIGDVNQLPSVGCGAILKDLIESNVVPVTRLTEIFRQKDGGSVIDNANIVINNLKKALICDDNFRIITVKNEAEGADKTVETVLNECNEWGIDNVITLSPRRVSKDGKYLCTAEGLNPLIQRLFINSTDVSATFNKTDYYIGDRVLQHVNNKDSSNGDVGVIKNIVQTDDGVFVEIEWENGNTTQENSETMKDITHAYAMSIHKSQGSEYSSVIIPLLSDQICPLFNSNLLYTAITRAKKRVTLIVDSPKVIDYCIANNNVGKRNTLLKLRIQSLSKQ